MLVIKDKLKRNAKLRTINQRLNPIPTPEAEARALYLEIHRRGHTVIEPPAEPVALRQYIALLKRELARE